MNTSQPHTFHIPVMGLGYTIDTPVKVARYGISSVVSIIQDHLVEQMREYYCKQTGDNYVPIPVDDIDHREKRITAYLNLLQKIVETQVSILKKEPFEKENDIVKYFELLPEYSQLKQYYNEMLLLPHSEKEICQQQLREKIISGSIDVNIMTKIDNPAYDKNGNLLPIEYSSAQSAFKGFANSNLNSSIVLSAGLNPRLYALIEKYPDFFPDEKGVIKKKIILKVSDYRSAIIQGKFLAKKGIWISEFRIESGLNCGGHAFPTEGYLLGPILEEFKSKKEELSVELIEMCNQALKNKNKNPIPSYSKIRLTVQGGIGTSDEDKFLMEYYNLDGTGWGSPFLLVPEATNVDDFSLKLLATAKQEDYYLSHASPLGIPFNNFKRSTAEEQRKIRIDKNRPGSPCYKKYLAFNTEYTEKPICVSSREYQNLKLKELNHLNLSDIELEEKTKEIVEKDCLCEGLSASVLLKNNIPVHHKLEAVAICPGPNLAYFSGVFTLKEMVNHIYGRQNILNSSYRPHMFVNELKMYIDYLKEEIKKSKNYISEKQEKYFSNFKHNILQGIEYYKKTMYNLSFDTKNAFDAMIEEIISLEHKIKAFETN